MREMNPRVLAGLVPLQWGFTRGNGARAICGARFMADLPRPRNPSRKTGAEDREVQRSRQAGRSLRFASRRGAAGGFDSVVC